jgi:hypothetical protein
MYPFRLSQRALHNNALYFSIQDYLLYIIILHQFEAFIGVIHPVQNCRTGGLARFFICMMYDMNYEDEHYVIIISYHVLDVLNLRTCHFAYV